MPFWWASTPNVLKMLTFLCHVGRCSSVSSFHRCWSLAQCCWWTNVVSKMFLNIFLEKINNRTFLIMFNIENKTISSHTVQGKAGLLGLNTYVVLKKNLYLWIWGLRSSGGATSGWQEHHMMVGGWWSDTHHVCVWQYYNQSDLKSALCEQKGGQLKTILDWILEVIAKERHQVMAWCSNFNNVA